MSGYISNPAQQPNYSIYDINGKQAYLGNNYTATSSVITLADTSEHPELYIANAATNSVGIFNYLRSLNCPDSEGAVIFRIYKNPTTVTGGTPITPQNSRFASSLASVATVLQAPSVVSNGTLISVLGVAFTAQSIDSVLYIIDPGQSMLITAQAVGSATTAIFDATWYEI